MGKANRARRRMKEKDRKRRQHAWPPRSAGPFASTQQSPAELAGLLVADALHAQSHSDDAAFLRCVAQLAVRPAVAGWRRFTEPALTESLERAVSAAWRLGWQPADVVRVVGRSWGGRHARVAADAIAAEMRAYAAATVDERWAAQLTSLGASVWWDGGDGYLQTRGDREGLDRAAVVARALEVLFVLSTLPKLPTLCPLPGMATRSSQHTVRDRARAVDERVLSRIRALLTKAESTEFPDEAEALSMRAQEMMARHSIDQALLATGSGTPNEPEGRRLAVDNPYEAPKALLVDVVAAANRCRAVWDRQLGFATVFGFRPDLSAVELLFTSLLVQATAAMVRAGARRDPYGRSRTRSFRQAFLSAYAHRIGERLLATADEATVRAAAEPAGANLLPVLAARDHVVDKAFDAIFPDLEYRRVARRYDRDGWFSGRAAADVASLTAHQEIAADQV